MSVEPLQVLLAKMRAGDYQAAERLCVAYEPQLRLIVRRQLSRRLRAKFDSQDVIQSVWTRILHHFRGHGCQIASPEHLRNFLVQVARNCLTDRLRHFRAALETEQTVNTANAAELAVSPNPRPSEIAQGNELWELILANCPPKHHELLRLKRQGLTLEAIAAQTGLHEGSVRRILRQLARKLAIPDGKMPERPTPAAPLPRQPPNGCL